MTDQELKDGNTAIRHFMKMPKYSMNMPYHSCWDFLMLAVEAIEALPTHEFHGKFGVHIHSNDCTIQGAKFRPDPENYHAAYFNEVYAETKILATWNAVVQFIKFYNAKFK